MVIFQSIFHSIPLLGAAPLRPDRLCALFAHLRPHPSAGWPWSEMLHPSSKKNEVTEVSIQSSYGYVYIIYVCSVLRTGSQDAHLLLVQSWTSEAFVFQRLDLLQRRLHHVAEPRHVMITVQRCWKLGGGHNSRNNYKMKPCENECSTPEHWDEPLCSCSQGHIGVGLFLEAKQVWQVLDQAHVFGM